VPSPSWAALAERVRGSLIAIRGWLPSAHDDTDRRARLEGVLTVRERSARLEGEMFNELHEVGRLSGQTALRRSSRVDLAELVRSVTAALRPAAEESGIQVHARCAASSVVVPADGEDLTQIVGRLLACAIQWSDRGGSVESLVSLDSDWVRLDVRAHGRDRGGPATPRLLEPSRASDLSAVRHLIERHGGIIRVQVKAPGAGATFTVMLPGEASVPEPAHVTTQHGGL
jgi:signal transduction histidine kinase